MGAIVVTGVIDDRQVLFMFLEEVREIVPVAGLGFRLSQTSESKLNREYVGALVVSRDGLCRRIERIEVKGLWGQSFGQKAVSALIGGRNIEVTFGAPLSIALDEFKDLVIRYIGYDSERGKTVPGDPYLPNSRVLEEVFGAIKSARDFSDVFDSINVPDADHCLDSL